MKEPLIIFIVLVLIICCSRSKSSEKEELRIFNITEKPKISEIKLSTLGFYDIEYIPLESTDSSMFKGINMIKTSEDFFLIHTYDRILRFGRNGSYEATIGSSGRGPDEYLVANDVEIDKDNHLIYLVDGLKKQLLVYSDDGKLLRKHKIICASGIQFRFINDGFLCYNENHSGNVENSYFFIDTCGRINKNFPNKYAFINQSKYVFMRENIFYRFNNRLYKKEIYSDTVFVFENMNFKPRFLIEAGERVITPKARSIDDGLYLAEHYITPWNLFEFGDYIYYEYLYESKIGQNNIMYGFIGFKKDNFQVFFNSEEGIINDLDGGPNICPKTTKNDDTIISWVDVLDLKNHVASDAFKNSTPKYADKKKELEKLAARLKETDNPVLMLVKLKN
ncbi:MAG: 6-bladed beta-propeller [Bacteroidota bacterium]